MKKTENVRHMRRLIVYEDPDYTEQVQRQTRPKTRADCASVPRPCPFVSCKYNMFLDVQPNGSIKYNHPGKEPEEMDPALSCALDLADKGKSTLQVVADAMGTIRERVRQIEVEAKANKAQQLADLADLSVNDVDDAVSRMELKCPSAFKHLRMMKG